MSVAPLTQKEQDELPHSFGAMYPRDSFLRCQCGYVGTARSTSSHRSSTGKGKHPVICSKPPDVFMSLDDAQAFEAEAGVARREALAMEEAGIRHELRVLNGEIVEPEPIRRPVGRPRKERPENVGETRAGDSRGGSGGGGTERVEVPRRLTTRITIDLPVDAAERCDRARLSPEYGFKGDIGDYLYQCEVAFWVIDAWLRAGQPCPLAEWQAAA